MECNENEEFHWQANFDKLNTAELIHFVLMVICDLHEVDCQPIHFLDTPDGCINSEDQACTFLQRNNAWVKSIAKELQQVTRQVDGLQTATLMKGPEFYRTTARNMEKAQFYAQDVLKTVAGDGLLHVTKEKLWKVFDSAKDQAETYLAKLKLAEMKYLDNI